MDEDAAPSNGSLSKKEKKKLNKKLKGENGSAVPAGKPESKADVAKPESKKEKGDKKDAKKDDGKKEKAKGDKTTLPSGIVIQDTKVGDGRNAKKGDTLGMRYIGKLENGKVFDSNSKGAPVRLPPFPEQERVAD
jgi:FK506-binding nuclear protein